MIALRGMICLLVMLAASPAPRETPSFETEAELRRAVTAIFGEPDARQRAAIVAEVSKLQKDHGIEILEEVVRKGPLYPRGEPEPRSVAGKTEKLSRFGTAVVGYSFTCEGQRFRYAVDFPAKYDSSKPHPVLIDPGHGTGKNKDDSGKADFLPFYRRQLDAARLETWLLVRTEIIEQVGADGLQKPLPEDRVARIFQAFFRDLGSRFHIDPDRIYVTGLSQTGFWTWYLGRARADRFAGIAPMSAVTWQVNSYASNFINLPVYVLHGSQDSVCPVDQPRTTTRRLATCGVPLRYEEVDGAGHDAAVWSRLGGALTWLADRPRNPYPRTISKSLQTSLDGWCYWLRVDELDAEGDGKAGTKPTGGIDAFIKGQTVHLFSVGVSRITLGLASELLDLDRPITVIWNGRKVHKSKVKRSLADLLEIVGDKADWTGTFEAKLTLTL